MRKTAAAELSSMIGEALAASGSCHVTPFLLQMRSLVCFCVALRFDYECQTVAKTVSLQEVFFFQQNYTNQTFFCLIGHFQCS